MNSVCRKICRMLAGWLAVGMCWAQPPQANGDALPTFGATVVAPFGFCGRIYEIPEVQAQPAIALHGSMDTDSPTVTGVGTGVSCDAKLPQFQRLKPIGNIYTTRLYVPVRDFRDGFPGVTRRFEWFAIDYTARFWIETPGKYSFELLSDDGSALYIDERRIIDNDCMHAPLSTGGSIRLEGGIHDMRVSYFQGPRYQVALVLTVQPPGGKWRIFDTGEFKAPANPADWKYSNPANLDAPLDPCTTERRPRKLQTRH